MGAYQKIMNTDGNLYDGIKRVADGAVIPHDDTNTDWQIFKAWVSVGNLPDEPDAMSVTNLKAAKITALYAACDAYIQAGFTSGVYIYPMKLTDQQNRDSAFLDVIDSSLLTPLASINFGGPWLLWCKDAAGLWARRSHTAAQVRTVRQDTRIALTVAQAKLASLIATVNAATTAAAIQAVKW